jgi:phosphatidylethanolamine-binding protein (PEBP) family uncharacterized protein
MHRGGGVETAPPGTKRRRSHRRSGYPNFSADGGRPHPYSFEVFALDTKLDLDPAQAKRKVVIDAMQGHVLASGVLVARFGADHFKPPR